jgi:hypothetical protein
MNIEGVTPEVVQQMMASVLEVAPEMASVLDDIRSKAKTEEEAVLLLAQWCEENVEVMERMASKFLAPIPANYDESVRSPLPHLLAPERAQFDGDVPEFRKGPLPSGVLPAVPVRTDSINPVQIGMQLEQAAVKVRQEIDRLGQEWRMALESAVEGTDMVLAADSPMPEPEGYKAGSSAEMVAVSGEVPNALLLTPQERQRYAWQTISSSQGRRSSLAQIAVMVQESLKKNGIDCEIRDFSPSRRVGIKAHASWSYEMTGKADLQPDFSFLEVAAGTIAMKLAETNVGGWLEVVPIDTVDIRKVGWACRIVEDK